MGSEVVSNEEFKMKNAIAEALQQSRKSLFAREIRFYVNSILCTNLPEYYITRQLRLLADEGSLVLKGNKWSVATVDEDEVIGEDLKKTVALQYPELSSFALEALRSVDPTNPFAQDESGKKISYPGEKGTNQAQEIFEAEGPWSTFRRLVAYYKECVRNEDGPDASAFLNDYGKKFLHFSDVGEWYPKAGRSWIYTIPLGEHLTEFVKELGKIGESAVVVLGYPLQAVYIKKDNEPETAIVRPVFHYILKASFNNGELTVTSENNRPEIGLDWLKYAFPTHEQQRNFLSACGLITSASDKDEVEDYEQGHGIPDLGSLTTTLSTFLSDKVREPLIVDEVSPEPLRTPFETGVYNRAVIMIGSRTRYSKNLLNELTAIESADDEVLDSTSLRYLFRDSSDSQDNKSIVEKNHESCVMDTDLMNAEQRQAVAALLSQNLSVITGPPGTGKSQVVCGGIANARLINKTTIFASRNHKAIDAVVNRFKDQYGRSLIVRTNSKEEPTLRYTFSSAIKDILAANYDITASERFKKLSQRLQLLLERRGADAELAYEVQQLRDELGDCEEKLSDLADQIPAEVVCSLEEAYEMFPIEGVRGLCKIISTNAGASGAVSAASRFSKSAILILALPKWLHVRSKLQKCISSFELSILKLVLNPIVGRKFHQLLLNTSRFAELKGKAAQLVLKQKGLPEFQILTASVDDGSQKIATAAVDALSLDLDRRDGLPQQGTLREDLASLKVALRAEIAGFVDEREQKKTKTILEKNIPLLLNHFPSWAVTNLSIGSRIPFFPGMFDLAIIDEASQSDIPSALPILFRAKRAAVVGDPKQLTHTSRLSVAKESLLRKRVGLFRFKDLKYSYTATSLYDLFAQSPHIKPTFLSCTYRSVDSIAEYSNTTFYGGILRVATDTSKLNIPSDSSAGIHWTDIDGEVKSAAGSGCYCAKEVEAVVEVVSTILKDNKFQGTLGVVTPFRQQANRIHDGIYSHGLHFEDLERVRFHVDTSHGFQGDEKDVMIFSLCAGPDMPRGSHAFLRETGNLFNVAASRARAVLHVIGNRNWAERCGIKHIQNLTKPTLSRERKEEKGQWYPHESPWEEILFKALAERGLNPVPQYPVTGRRLDMALVGEGEFTKRIDIEVDGDRYHRNRDGSRKLDDIWRDMQLQGMGWIVMRFWVYQLREDLDSCVDKIVTAWSRND